MLLKDVFFCHVCDSIDILETINKAFYSTFFQDLMFVGIQLRFTGFSNEDVIPAVNVSSSQGTTAFQLLQLASKQNPCYLFEYQTFEGLGHYITTICCVAQNTTTHSYWFVYINNTLSPVGVDFLKPNNGDILRFEYRSINYIDGNHTEPTPTTAAGIKYNERIILTYIFKRNEVHFGMLRILNNSLNVLILITKIHLIVRTLSTY